MTLICKYYQKQINVSSAEMHRCLWLVFSYYVQDTYGEVDILTSDFYFHSVTVFTDCIDCNCTSTTQINTV